MKCEAIHAHLRITLWLAAATASFGFARPAAASGNQLEWQYTQLVPIGQNGFPTAVAISGSLAVVGVSADDAVYVLARSGNTWSLQQKLVASDAGPSDDFGASVAIEGQTVLVGATGASSGGVQGAGAAYLFTQSGSTWTQQARLVENSPSADGHFGASVGLAGGTAAVAGSDGAIGLFAPSGTTWTALPALALPASIPQNGWNISTSAGMLIAWGPPTFVSSQTPTSSSSEAYIYGQSGSVWSLEYTFALPNMGDFVFGAAVSETTAVVASSQAFYILAKSGTTWALAQTFVPPDNNAHIEAGAFVGFDGTTMVLSTQYYAWVYTLSGGIWTQQPSNMAAGPVAVSGDAAIVMAGVWMCADAPANGDSCTDGSQCGSGICSQGVCCNRVCGPCGDCSSGTCVATAGPGNPPCQAPYACSGDSTPIYGNVDLACPTDHCDEDGDCMPADYCCGALHLGQYNQIVMSPDECLGGGDGGAGDAGVDAARACVPKLPLHATCLTAHECTGGECVDGGCHGSATSGTRCTENDECANDLCVDGYCCDSACTGQCQACDVAGSPGVCSAIVNAPPHGARPACGGAGTSCEGTCNGVASPTACEYPSATTCGSTCSGGERTTSTCDGAGHCRAGVAQQCPGNFACSAAGSDCSTTCARDGDCAAGFACVSDRCVPPKGDVCIDPRTSQNPNAAGDAGISDCRPYLCDPASGICRTTCVTAADCVSPDLCDTTGHCGPAPTTSENSGCACRESPGAPLSGGADLAALGGLAALARASRRRRRKAPREGRVAS
jgi:hypothetical protein